MTRPFFAAAALALLGRGVAAADFTVAATLVRPQARLRDGGKPQRRSGPGPHRRHGRAELYRGRGRRGDRWTGHRHGRRRQAGEPDRGAEGGSRQGGGRSVRARDLWRARRHP